jgi:hypothetical protein
MALQMDYTDKYGQLYTNCYWVVRNFHWERNQVNELTNFVTVQVYINREAFQSGFDYIYQERYPLDLTESDIANYDNLRHAIYEALKVRPEFVSAADVIETPEVMEETTTPEETPVDPENPIINP